MRGCARIYDVRMAQFVLKIEKLAHIIGASGSQDLRSPSPIMAPGVELHHEKHFETQLLTTVVWEQTLYKVNVFSE